jgi:hypothetical protein
MKNKTQRRIHKYFFSHYFYFVFFRKNNIRGSAATNNTPNEEKKIIEEKSGKSKGYNIINDKDTTNIVSLQMDVGFNT